MLRPLDEMQGYARTASREFQESVAFADENFGTSWSDVGWPTLIENAVLRWFYRPVATSNRLAALVTVVRDKGTHPTRCKGVARLPDRLDAYDDVEVDWLFNPTGKWLIGYGSRHTAHSVQRLCDLANEIALIRVQLELRLADVPPPLVPAFLAKRTALNNLYTDQPFDWAEGARVLSFVRLAPRSRESPVVRVSLPAR